MLEYLALPYTDKDEEVMDFRASVSDIIWADLSNQGRFVYAPISSAHHIAKQYDLPRDWEFWQHLDTLFISKCDRFLIITLPGWEDSTGVTAETEIAKSHGMEIEHIDPTPYIKKLEAKNV